MRKKYPFREMKVGEAVVIKDPPKHITSRVSEAGLRYGYVFRTCRVPGGQRVERRA